MSFFDAPSRLGAEWFSVGLASSFPDSGLDDDNLAKYRTCSEEYRPGCKVFQVPREDSSQRAEVLIDQDGDLESSDLKGLKDQVLVFKYRGKFHAVDHKCPHSSYPLSQATPFDIEDFGVVLSAGLTCPKHGWSFDLFTGSGDRGNYQLGLWETQLREVKGSDTAADKVSGPAEQEVWVRRKQRQRIG
ncbi:hypothetical protein N5P37_007652 [Trichoderma harzianum]|nr:hypothetical protein N5P37_007652 [Trichoderma harzianum]